MAVVKVMVSVVSVMVTRCWCGDGGGSGDDTGFLLMVVMVVSVVVVVVIVLFWCCCCCCFNHCVAVMFSVAVKVIVWFVAMMVAGVDGGCVAAVVADV